MATIYPSLLGVNMLNISKEIETLDPYCAGYHIDILDNHFAPNLGFSFAFTNAIAKQTAKQLWIHLMIKHPEQFLDRLSLRAGSIVSFHCEATDQIASLSRAIRAKGWLASIALSPKTSVKTIHKYLPDIDQVLIMGVEPGFAGQAFIPRVENKIDELVQIRTKTNPSLRIGIDGGITDANIHQLAEQGVDDFAISSAIFSKKDSVAALQELQQLAEK